jgi:hypothetical protein
MILILIKDSKFLTTPAGYFHQRSGLELVDNL